MDDSEIKFPAQRPGYTPPVLALPRRRGLKRPATEISEASVAARRSIKEFVSATRSPFGTPRRLENSQIAELEHSLRNLELKLAERERLIAETENRLAESARQLYEFEALLSAREKLLAVSRQTVAPAPISAEEKAALEQLRTEIERQQTSIDEARRTIREREQFLDESENTLFSKVQSQQENDIQLDQRDDDLRIRERRLREAEAKIDPEAAARLAAEDEAARKRDEFRE
mgnify:CR=1 FL=1